MNFESYFQYLNKRSLTSLFYRKFYLYPRINKNLINPILDVGCGIGDYLRFNTNAKGADINNLSIKKLQDEGLNAYLIKNNKLEFKDKSFNSIILDNVLEHIEDPKPLLREIYRVLNNKGIFLIGLPGIKGFESDPDHKKNYSMNELDNLIIPQGYKFKKRKFLPLNLFFLSRTMKQFCSYSYYIKD